MRPISTGFGEFINNFYSSLTKNLPFWQAPFIAGCVTLILIPLCVYLLSLFSLILFDYEFSFFFNCISFRKSRQIQQQQQPTIQQASIPQQAVTDSHTPQLLTLLARLSNENEKLIADSNKLKMIESQSKKNVDLNESTNTRLKQLKAIEYSENVNEDILNNSLANHFDVFISNVNSKEEEYQKVINALKAENEKLKTISLSPVKKDLGITKQRQQEPEQQQRQSELLDNSIDQEKENIQQVSTPQSNSIAPSKNEVVSIGLSKTVLNRNRINMMNNNKLNSSFKQKKERELLQESNDSNTAFEDTEDDDADDIFVILEDN